MRCACDIGDVCFMNARNLPIRWAAWLGLVLAACTGSEARYAGEASASLRASGGAGGIDQVVIDGLSFDVQVEGPDDGEPIILLHGFPETHFEWRHQLPLLAAAGYRVLAPSLRGTSPGARPVAVDAYGLLNYVNDVIQLADAYQIDRFHLVGHDVGALVAWGTAQLFGTRLRSLTAVSVPHPGAFAAQLADPDSCQSRASAWYGDLLAPDAAVRLLQGTPAILLEAWSALGPEAEAEYRRVLGTPAALDATLNLWRANFVDGQPQGALPLPVFVPTLFVWGEDDPYNCGLEGEPLTQSLTWAPYQFAPMPGVGHFVPEQEPERFYDLLEKHLERNRS